MAVSVRRHPLTGTHHIQPYTNPPRRTACRFSSDVVSIRRRRVPIISIRTAQHPSSPASEHPSRTAFRHLPFSWFPLVGADRITEHPRRTAYRSHRTRFPFNGAGVIVVVERHSPNLQRTFLLIAFIGQAASNYLAVGTSHRIIGIIITSHQSNHSKRKNGSSPCIRSVTAAQRRPDSLKIFILAGSMLWQRITWQCIVQCARSQQRAQSSAFIYLPIHRI